MISTPRRFQSTQPLSLSSGKTLDSFEIAYETYGQLNDTKSNAILVCHALSGSSHAAFKSPDTNEAGWWDGLIGPNKALDTHRYFIICTNTIGSCKGSTGPTSINPNTQTPYGIDFPIITIDDMVRAQKQCIDSMGITQLHAVVGGSMGGMQALTWSTLFPTMMRQCVSIAATFQLTAPALAFGTVGRNAIMNDPEWNDGHYTPDSPPKTGLATARMIGHLTYLSPDSIQEKFGRRLQDKDHVEFKLNTEFQIESYLRYQGDKFVDQFDANAYLFLSRAMSYFDLAQTHGSFEKAFKPSQCSYLIMSISSDWLYPPSEIESLANNLLLLNKSVSYAQLESIYGHDAFLIEYSAMNQLIAPFLNQGDFENVS